MKRIATPITTDQLCKYGCGNVAKFTNKSGSLMCSTSPSSCPEMKKINSNGLVKAYETGTRRPAKEVYSSLPEDTKNRMNWNKGNYSADFSYNGRGNHKAVLISERGYKCESCGLTEWLGKPIPLELEHNDADVNNNNKDNLTLLCCNCHAQTPSWKRGNYSGWKRQKYSDEQMVEAIQTSTCLNQVLKKLNLRYGSAQTIVNVMSKYNVSFMRS